MIQAGKQSFTAQVSGTTQLIRIVND